MFTLDSDLLGILMALLSIILPALLSAWKKKKTGKEQPAASEDESPDEVTWSDLGEMVEIHREDFSLEGEQATSSVVVEDAIDEQSDVEKPKELKGRLKENPKDMVLFAEIMNPKYKEY